MITDEKNTDVTPACPEAPDGQHAPDVAYATPANGVDDVIDVPCRYCGRSGATQIAAEDVQWD